MRGSELWECGRAATLLGGCTSGTALTTVVFTGMFTGMFTGLSTR